MKLMKLELTNFKGIRSFTFEPHGQNATILGDNASGKTTIYDGFLWSLFDKDSAGAKAFEIKTLTNDGKPIHGLEHGVEAVFDINGAPLTLKKVYAEKLTKRRGQAQSEITGHTTSYWIDGVPVKAKEYQARVKEIANEDLFRLLTNPSHFSEGMKWQERREMLLAVCGDITDADVIAQDTKLEPLAVVLEKRTIEDHRKVLASERARVNEELQKTPTRIDEASRSRPTFEKDAEALRVEIDMKLDAARKELHKRQLAVQNLGNGNGVSEQQKIISGLEANILQLENAHKKAVLDLSEKRDAELRALKRDVTDNESELREWVRLISEKQDCVNDLQAKCVTLRGTFKIEAEKEFAQPEMSGVCPTCGQVLPQDQIQAAMDKALEAFNFQKSQKLEDINKRGSAAKAESSELEKAIVSLRQKKAACEQRLQSAREALEKEQSKPAPEVIEPDNLISLRSELEAAHKVLEDIKGGSTEQLETARAVVATVEDALKNLESEAAEVKQHFKVESRINELQDQEKRLAEEFERIEGELFLTEEFVRTKVSMLEEKINEKFSLVRFKLFAEQINGGLSECCEMTVNGVPYASLNRAAKLQGGLDIIATLAAHYELYPPIFIDNAEAVTSLPEMRAQMIGLYVDAEAKELQVSVESSEAVKAAA